MFSDNIDLPVLQADNYNLGEIGDSVQEVRRLDVRKQEQSQCVFAGLVNHLGLNCI